MLLDLYTITTHQTLDRIARNCPRALCTFIHVLTRADQEGIAVLEKKQIVEDLSESFAKFRNDLRSLAREDLLEWRQIGSYLHITLAMPENIDDGA